MKLHNSLYRIISDELNDAGHDYTINLDPEHFIYKAHFPGEPITPGVCIMQIAQELLEMHTGLELGIKCVKNVKFLRIIRPDETPTVTYRLQKIAEESEEVKVSVTVLNESDIFAKLSIVCRKEK